MVTLKKNSQHDINITDVDAKGFGIGRVNDFTVFIDGALPDDRLRVRILKVKPRYAYGKIERIITPSPHRKESACPMASFCGGCQLQHCEYESQLLFKKRNVINALERIGKIEKPPVAEVIGMDEPYRYRNKAVFPVGDSGIGVYAARSHRIVPVGICNIQHPAHEAVLAAVWDYMQRYQVPAYDEVTYTGLMRQVMIRTGNHDNEIMVVCVINGEKLPHEAVLTDALVKCGAATVLISPHTRKNNVVLGDNFRVLHGSGTLRQRLGDIEYQLSPRSFFQINTVQAEILYEKAISFCDFTGGETIIDAHAGVGGVALYAARHVKRVMGVEIIPEAVEDAKYNAALNHIDNAEFICGAAEQLIPEILLKTTMDVIFLDPPRKGCGKELLNAIIQAKIKKVVYISCDPATLARDLAHLTQHGYEIRNVQPVDMFPQTGKVECVAGLALGK